MEVIRYGITILMPKQFQGKLHYNTQNNFIRAWCSYINEFNSRVHSINSLLQKNQI